MDAPALSGDSLVLVPEDDPILRRPCDEFDFDNPPHDPVELAAAMFSAMRRFQGVGLAAPQVGIPYRMFVLGTDDEFIACFNPSIVTASNELARVDEGCLSFPNLFLKVERPRMVVGAFCNERGEAVQRTFNDFQAQAYTHEFDHLNGIVFTDKVGPLARKMALDRRKKLFKRQRE